MKKHILILFILFFTTNTLMQAQTVFNFKLINNTGKDIYEVLLAAMDKGKNKDSDSHNFGENILPKNVLKNGESVSVKFSYIDDETICDWIIKLTHDKKEIKDEHSWIFLRKVELCEVSILTIYIEDGDYAFTVE